MTFRVAGRAVSSRCSSAQEKTALGPEPSRLSFAATTFRASTPASALPTCHFWTAIQSAGDVEAGRAGGRCRVGRRGLEGAISCGRLRCRLLPVAMVSASHTAQPLCLRRQRDRSLCRLCLPGQSTLPAGTCEPGSSPAPGAHQGGRLPKKGTRRRRASQGARSYQCSVLVPFRCGRGHLRWR